jgi:superfamily II DNA or RNA helicase
VVVASVPTLGRKGSKRLNRLEPDRFFLIVVDEAHHATAKTYRRILKYLGVFDPDTRKLLVGFTATPKRGDGQGLDAVFQEIVFSRSLPEMVGEGYLSPVAGYRVETDIDLTRVRTRMGDFVVSHLSRAVNVEQRNRLVVEVFRSRLKDRKTLCFCVDVAHAHSLAETFKTEGIPAGAISGDMEGSERTRVLNDFSQGRIRVLANCMVLTEGYDEPSVEGIILARPTKSTLLYTQMIGRGTRLHPGKDNVMVVDIVDVTRDHSLTSLPGLFGLSGEFDLEGRTVQEAQDALRWVEINRPWIPITEAISLTDLRYRCKRINLFDLETPDELLGYSRYAWVSIGKGAYRLGLSEGRAVMVAPTILGDWEVLLGGRERETVLARRRDIRAAIMVADAHVREKLPECVGLVTRHTRWRRDPATKKQINILRAKKLDVPKGLTKGQASHLISMLT